VSLDEMIKQAQEKGLISISPLAMRGKSDSVFGLLSIMARTKPLRTSDIWLGVN
jgi:hypothetical protein